MIEEVLPQVLERLSSILQREITEADLKLGHESLGADSMDMVVLAYELESIVGGSIKPEIFLQHDSILGALEAVLEQQDASKNE